MNEQTTAWIFVIIASVFETLWLIALKYLDMKALVSWKWVKFDNINESLSVILPFIGYIAFGLANVVFFSNATKKIPLSLVFAVWLSLALILTTICDILYFKTNYNKFQIFFLVIIIIGVLGLKMNSAPAE